MEHHSGQATTTRDEPPQIDRDETTDRPSTSLSLGAAVGIAASGLTALAAVLGPLYVLGLFAVERQVQIVYGMPSETAWRTALLLDRPRLILHGMATASNPSILPVFVTLLFFLVIDIFDHYFIRRRASDHKFLIAMIIFVSFCGIYSFGPRHIIPFLGDWGSNFTYYLMFWVAYIPTLILGKVGMNRDISLELFNVLTGLPIVAGVHVMIGLTFYSIVKTVDAPLWAIILSALAVALCSTYLTIVIRTGGFNVVLFVVALLAAYIAALFPVYWIHTAPRDYGILPFSSALLCEGADREAVVQYVAHTDGYWYMLAARTTVPGQEASPLLVIEDSAVHELPMGTSAPIGSDIKGKCK